MGKQMLSSVPDLFLADKSTKPGVWKGVGSGIGLFCLPCAEGRTKGKECFNRVLDPEDKEDEYAYPCAGPL